MGDSVTGHRGDGAADRVVLTYAPETVPEDLRPWVHDELTGGTFGSSFRSRHDAVREGARFEEFVSRGCGTPVDVTLRAATVVGGRRLDSETEVVIERSDRPSVRHPFAAADPSAGHEPRRGAGRRRAGRGRRRRR